MHRRSATIDDKAFEALDAVLDDGFCICAIVTDDAGRPVDYRFLRVNHAFAEQTGLRDAEGRTALELVPDLEPKWIERYGRVALGREPARFEDGSPVMGRHFEVFAAPIDPPGCFVVHFRDASALKRLAAEREVALAESRRLLQELHHRVMNSFAAIGAIVAMEARAADPGARPALDRVQGRVQALGALYRRLDGGGGAVDRVDLADYIGGNVRSFSESHGDGAAPVEAEIARLHVPTRAAVPIALIVNELLTNAAKHGRGPVRVRLAERDGRCRIEVANGVAPLADAAPGTGIGRSLVRAFATELGGRFEFQEDAGEARATVTFPMPHGAGDAPVDAPGDAPVDAPAPIR